MAGKDGSAERLRLSELVFKIIRGKLISFTHCKNRVASTNHSPSAVKARESLLDRSRERLLAVWTTSVHACTPVGPCLPGLDREYTVQSRAGQPGS